MESIIHIEAIVSSIKKEVKQFSMPLSDKVHVDTKNPFKVLVATILSARTNDKITYVVSSELFKKVKKPQDIEKISITNLESIIRKVNFHKNKAKYLKKLPKALERFDFQIPANLNDLLSLPGVGRKTANIVLAVAYNKPVIGVDTHVHKIMNRLGSVKTKSPEETEKELMKIVPEKHRKEFNSLLVTFGQNICTPISPKCSKCAISKYCRKIGVKKSR